MDSRVSTIYFLARRFGAWLLAVATADVLASVTAPQSVLCQLAGMGITVHLVEKLPSIGGKMAQLDKTFPTNDCAI